MADELRADEALLQRLPLPLAQLYRRAINAKNPLARHLTGFYFWEASIKLLAAVAVVEFAQQDSCDSALQERLENLARPALGHWWEFARLLVPRLAERGVGPFEQLRELLLGKARSDLPRTAGLDALLRHSLDGKEGQRATVQIGELLDRLIRHRNRTQGHGAAAQLPDATHERLGKALIAAAAEFWGRVDVLAGRQLIHIGEIRQVAGAWLVERFELTGESARRLESLAFPHEAGGALPIAGRLYLETGLAEANAYPHTALHPLVLFDAETEEVLFLNARRGRQRTEYLCYTSGRTSDRPDLGPEQRDLVARVLGMPVGEDQAAKWAVKSQAEDPAPTESPDCERRTLGEFELVSELGRGGMGVVYRSWQPSLGRQVAVKKLHQTGDDKAQRRFQREISALGKVEHPNLVKIFTSGSAGDQWFYAMELIEGVPLSAVCERLQSRNTSIRAIDFETWQDAVTSCCEEARSAEKPLSEPSLKREPEPGGPERILHSETDRNYIRHIVTLMAQVAEAAHALHEGGILHRDIKPGNIMVTQDGRQAVLMDLGLAQLADDVEGRLTRTRQFVGTLRYAGPQQVLAVGRLDRRADVYSLGATLWELLALAPLFGATEQMPTPELMEKIQREEPERLRAKHPGLPRDLEAIVHKCLDKVPKQRYATAHDLARDLNRFLDGRPVQARAVSGVERGWKWAKRRPAVASLTAALVLALVAGFAMVTWRWQEELVAREAAEKARDQEQQAKVKEQLAHQEADRRKHEAEAKTALALKYWGDLRDAIGKMLTEVSEGNQFLKNEPRFELVRKRLLERALAYYQRFLQEQSEDPTVQLATADAYVQVADIHSELGSKEEAEKAYGESLRMLGKLHEAFPGERDYAHHLAAASLGLGRLLIATGRHPKAVPELRRAQDLEQQLLDKFPSAEHRAAVAAACSNLGIALEATAQMQEAEKNYARAIDLCQGLVDEFPALPEHRHRLASSCHNLGILLRLLGRLPDSEKMFRRALTHRQELAKEFPSVPTYRQGLSRTNNSLGALLQSTKPREAKTHFEKAIGVSEELTKDFPSVADYRWDLSEACHSLGILLDNANQPAGAEKYFKQGLDLCQKLVADYPTVVPYRFGLSSNLSSLGIVQERLGRPSEAENLYRQALKLDQELVTAIPDVSYYRAALGNTHFNLGDLFANNKRLPESEEHYCAAFLAYQTLAERFPERIDYSLEMALAKFLLGDAHFRQKHWKEAKPAFEDAVKHYDAILAKRPNHGQAVSGKRQGAPRLAATCLELGLHAEAAATASSMVKLAEKDSSWVYSAAALLARCVPLAMKDAALAADEQVKLKQSYSDQAIALLQRAVDNGYRNADKLKNDPVFGPLRELEAFQGLLRDLEMKTRGLSLGLPPYPAKGRTPVTAWSVL